MTAMDRSRSHRAGTRPYKISTDGAVLDRATGQQAGRVVKVQLSRTVDAWTAYAAGQDEPVGVFPSRDTAAWRAWHAWKTAPLTVQTAGGVL